MKKIFLILLLTSLNFAQSSLLTLMSDEVFTPDKVSGLVNWYAQTYTKYLTSDSVSVWTDDISGDNCTPLDVSYSPRGLSNIVNSYSALRFDGSDDHYKFTTFNYTAYSIFIVFNATAKTADAPLITRAYSAAGLWVSIVPSNDGTNPNKLSFNVNNAKIYSSSAVTGAWKIATLLFGAGTNEKQIYINGTYNSQANGVNPNYNAGDQPAIGTLLTTGGARLYLYSGDIAEILIYNVRVASADRVKIETYLNKKYTIY